MNTYKNNRLLCKIILLILLSLGTQNNIFTMEQSTEQQSAKDSLYSLALYKLIAYQILPQYIEKYVSFDLKFCKTYIDFFLDLTDKTTKNAVQFLACMRKMLMVDKESYNFYMRLYDVYIEIIFNTCCYDKKYYTIDNKLKNQDKNTIKKRPEYLFMQICGLIIFSNNTNIGFLNSLYIDLFAYGDSNYAVKKFDNGYFSVASMLEEPYKNNFFSMLNNNYSNLLLFIQKVFHFTRYDQKKVILYITIDPICALPEYFLHCCNETNVIAELTKHTKVVSEMNRSDSCYYKPTCCPLPNVTYDLLKITCAEKMH